MFGLQRLARMTERWILDRRFVAFCHMDTKRNADRDVNADSQQRTWLSLEAILKEGDRGKDLACDLAPSGLVRRADGAMMPPRLSPPVRRIEPSQGYTQ